MENRILEIVVLMIDYLRENPDHYLNIDDLSSTLKARGYTDNEISSAYSWLMERYDNVPETRFSDFPESTSSGRVLTDFERRYLSIEAQGFLYKLLSFSLIDNEQFEMILDRSSMASGGLVDTDHIKMIASAVIFQDLDQFEQFSFLDSEEDSSLFIN